MLIRPKPTRLRIGHVSTAAVFSEYESFEWLFRETYKKAGCYVLGAKLLQFFETPKFLVTILWTHDIFLRLRVRHYIDFIVNSHSLI